jgi:hypothetical protein
LRVVHFARASRGPRDSLDRVFRAVRAALPPDVDVRTVHCPRRGAGPLDLLLNLAHCRRHSGRVNHITGDVHYLAIALPRRNTVLTVADCVTYQASFPRDHDL